MKKILDKIKLLFVARKPVLAIMEQVKDIKRGYKTLSFWVALLSSLGAFVAAIKGFLPGDVAVIAIAFLGAGYNILRGLNKADEPGVKPALWSTEFWMGLLAIVQGALIEIQTAGVDGEWLTACLAFIAAGMAAGQSLGSNQPIKDN